MKKAYVKKEKDINNTFLSIQRGKFLQVQTIRQISEIWQEAFPGYKPLEPRNRKFFANDVFFILRSPEKEILSVGRLRPINGVSFLGKLYNIQGIGDIVSVIERKGYGKAIMHAIHKYLSRRKQTGVGFCTRDISPFYPKCGFKIVENLTERFLYKNSEGKIMRDEEHIDVLYLSGINGFMEKLLEYPKKTVLM